MNEELRSFVRAELNQRREEGYATRALEENFSRMGEAPQMEELERIYEETGELKPRDDFPYREPSTLADIRKERPTGPRSMRLELSPEELLDRIHGAWLGRCAGCCLGKRVEGWSREKIERYLRAADAYPLRDYFQVLDPFPEGLALWDNYKETTKGNIRYAARDDDIDYTILGLWILEKHGFAFTPTDVGRAWLRLLPYEMVYTAERVAYRNLVNGLLPPETATYRNPFREWIGAQIRADIWGYVAPGQPELAAELAFRDASVSHVKNGIYGEMLVSAMLVAAFCSSDVEKIIVVGLSEIPQNCRLSEAVNDVINWSQDTRDWKEVWGKIMQKYGHYHPVHTIINTAMIILALLFGRGDFERSITLAVMCGLDTDCTGATTGSILGVMLGRQRLPEKWTAPLNDEVRSSVVGFNGVRISDLAARTVAYVPTVAE